MRVYMRLIEAPELGMRFGGRTVAALHYACWLGGFQFDAARLGYDAGDDEEVYAV